MVLPRTVCVRGAQSFGRIASRRAGIAVRSNITKQIGRRTYASGHEAKQSSDLPWMIGAVVFTVPAATWLLGQGPSKSDHGHGEHEEKHEEGGDEEPKAEESEKSKDEESKEEPAEESKDDSDEGSKEDSKGAAEGDSEDAPKDGEADDSKDSGDSKTSLDEEYDGPSPGKDAQYFRNPDKKPGEGQKGDRPPTEKKGEKDSQSNYSGADHPYISDPSKSRKSAGLTDTAKIHGTAKPTYANPTEPSRPAPPSETKERA